MKFANISLMKKNILGGCIPLLFFSLLCMVSIFSIRSVSDSFHRLHHTHRVIQEAMNVQSFASDMKIGVRGFLLTEKEEFLDPYNNGEEAIYEAIVSLQETVADNPEQVRRLDEIRKIIATWQKKVIGPAIALRREVGKDKEIKMLVSKGDGEKYFDTFRQMIAAFKKTEKDLMKMRKDDLEESLEETVLIIAVGTSLTVIIALIFSFYFTNIIIKPILKAVELAEVIGRGDFSQRLEVRSDDEIGKLVQALNTMAQSLGDKENQIRKNMATLKHILERVSSVSDQLKNASRQVSDSSQSLSGGTTEQAASLEQVSSSMIEIGSQTRSNAENAFQASQLATQSRESAAQGAKEMANMILAMEEIHHASQSIAKIIKVIDEIAFQTNLLALNAAVEAARAGRDGKGFAVVAEEVRNLAGRSAKAAKETADLIEGAARKVEKGNEIAAKTDDALSKIVEAAVRVAELISEIADSCNEQATAIDQVNQGLGQIDQMTQQNAARSEETASVAEELDGQALQLQRILGQFESDEGGSDQTNRDDAYPEISEKIRPSDVAVPEKSEEAEVPDQNSGRDIVYSEDILSLDDDEFESY